MGTARALIARACVAFAIAIPWLGFVEPRHALGRAVLVALLLAGSFHGWGCGLAWLVRRRAEPLLALAWGIAVVTAFLGSAMAASLHAQIPVLVIGLVLHGLSLGARFRVASSELEGLLRGEAVRWWIAPAILIAVIGAMHVLATAGGVALRPFDDDGHVLAQVRRLLDTGTLADPIGYARASQLGASVALGALGSVFGDLALVRLVDALGFVLVLVLVCRAIGLRDATSSVWAGVVVVTLGFVAVQWPDPSPLWLPVALALALAQTVGEPAPVPAMLIPVGLVAGALIALRLEWMPFAAVLAAAAWQPRDHAPAARLVRASTLVAGIFVVVLPYVLVRVTAWSGAGHVVAALVLPKHFNAAIALAIAAVALPMTALVVARVPSRVVRWSVLATVASIAGAAGRLTAGAPYYSRYVWPIAAACALILLVETARTAPARVSGLAMVIATACVLLGYEARLAHRNVRLDTQYSEIESNLEYARSAQARIANDPDYERLLALVPRGPVAVWVVRPERLDYARHAIIDLRVPRLWAQRGRPWQADNRDGLVPLLRVTKLRYLLVEDDGAARRYGEENPIAGWLCNEHCVDPFERMLAGQRLLGRAGATRLYELRW